LSPFQLFLFSKINLGVEAYTSLIAGYAEIGEVMKAFKTFEVMAAKGIQPNVFTHTALMSACFRAGDIVSARDLLQKAMKESSKNKENLRALYGSYVIGLSKLGSDMDNDTKTAFYDMIKLNLFPDTATMNAVIQNMCGKSSKNENVLQALEMTSVMMRKGFIPDDFTYSILFTALGRAGEIKEVARLFETANMTFDPTTINSMLGAYASSEDPLTCVQIFEKLIYRDSKNGEIDYFFPTKITYTILFSAIAQSAMLYSVRSEDNDFNVPRFNPKEYDKMTRKIFKSMRFDNDIEIDNIMLNVLNRLAGLYYFDQDNTLFSSQRLQGEKLLSIYDS
jgi:pentatricopeptide repeat protein